MTCSSARIRSRSQAASSKRRSSARASRRSVSSASSVASRPSSTATARSTAASIPLRVDRRRRTARGTCPCPAARTPTCPVLIGSEHWRRPSCSVRNVDRRRDGAAPAERPQQHVVVRRRLAGRLEPRERVGRVDSDERVVAVVALEQVRLRQVPLDQPRLQEQRLQLRARRDPLDVHDLLHAGAASAADPGCRLEDGRGRAGGRGSTCRRTERGRRRPSAGRRRVRPAAPGSRSRRPSRGFLPTGLPCNAEQPVERLDAALGRQVEQPGQHQRRRLGVPERPVALPVLDPEVASSARPGGRSAGAAAAAAPGAAYTASGWSASGRVLANAWRRNASSKLALCATSGPSPSARRTSSAISPNAGLPRTIRPSMPVRRVMNGGIATFGSTSCS